MTNAAAYANQTFFSAKSDHWESAFYVKGAALRAKRTAKKEATRALRRSKARHIADA